MGVANKATKIANKTVQANIKAKAREGGQLFTCFVVVGAGLSVRNAPIQNNVVVLHSQHHNYVRIQTEHTLCLALMQEEEERGTQEAKSEPSTNIDSLMCTVFDYLYVFYLP